MYIIVENIILPQAAAVLKSRNWNIKDLKVNSKTKQNLKEIVTISNLSMIDNYYKSINLNSNNWLNNEIRDIKINTLSDLNSNYMIEVENYILTKRTKEEIIKE
jgi:hypothetical protein